MKLTRRAEFLHNDLLELVVGFSTHANRLFHAGSPYGSYHEFLESHGIARVRAAIEYVKKRNRHDDIAFGKSGLLAQELVQRNTLYESQDQ